LVAPGASPGLKESKDYGGASSANVQGGGVDMSRKKDNDQGIAIIKFTYDLNE